LRIDWKDIKNRFGVFVVMTPRALLDDQKPLAGSWLRLSVGLGFANGMLMILQAWLLAWMIDAAIFADVELGALGHLFWLLLLLFILRATVGWASEETAFRAAAQVKLKIRDKIYRHIQVAGPAWLAGQRSGALVEDLTKGIEGLEGYYARYIPAMSLTVLVPFAILLVVLPLDWLSGLVMLLTAPLIPLFMVLIGQKAEDLNRRQWKALARMGAHFLDVIQGLTTLKLFNASRREGEIIARISDEYRRTTMDVLRIAFLTSAVLEFFATIGIAIIAVFIGFRLYQVDLPVPAFIAPPEVSFFSGFFILLLAPEFYLPLRSLGTHYHSRMEAIAAAERLVGILEAPAVMGERAGGGGTAAAGRRGRPMVRFDDVWFSYEAGRPALRGVSFVIKPEERVAVVGPSGAGKTTVANLLLGFVRPDKGRIMIDDMDFDALNIDEWRRRLAWLPQRPRLFQGTLFDNIRLGMPDASVAAVEDAARRAYAEEFVNRLPEGLGTRVGENGAGLSGGQVQRIALARAFLRDADLVILDEATANLDPASERLVQEAVDQLAQRRSMLIIAHRLTTVRDADCILVLDGGRIVEAGKHEGLLERDGIYRRMVQILETG
jgi:ATP-binding cassette subfamily C protein CydD